MAVVSSMVSTDINIIYFAEANKTLFSSLQRYFNYILNQKLNPFSATESVDSNSVLFVHQEEKENTELLNILVNNSNIEVVVIGYDSNSAINIVDLANLKNNLESELSNADFKSHQLFTEEELKEKLKKFFRSHGEDSLFEYLSYTLYYLREGPIQFISGNITFEEYQNNFLSKGIRKWEIFMNKFQRYSYIIKMYSSNNDSNEMTNLLIEIDSYINKLSSIEKEMLTRMNINYLKLNLDKINKINDILKDIYKDVSFGKSSLQNPAC